MKLDALTIRETQRAFAAAAEFVMDEPLLRGDAPARHFAADHEAPRLVELFLRARGAEVTVVLLIGAVEFKQHVLRFLHMRERRIGKGFGNVAAQTAGLGFDFFDSGFGHGVF